MPLAHEFPKFIDAKLYPYSQSEENHDAHMYKYKFRKLLIKR